MFYIVCSERLANESGRKSYKRLAAACKKLGVEWLRIDPDNFDSSKDDFGEKDSYYRISVGKRARLVEEYLLFCGVKSLYRSTPDHLYKEMSLFEKERLYVKNGVQSIPCEFFPARDEEVLKRQVERIGGFPVIVKERGGFSGKGVAKVDSLSSLMSVLGVILGRAKGEIILKKYIRHDEQARIIVLGDKVVGQKANVRNSEEIRLNTGGNFSQEPRNYSRQIQEMAIKATNLLGLKFAGVDILIGEDGKNYVAEVNMPCAFTYTEDATGVDIAGRIVEYLTK